MKFKSILVLTSALLLASCGGGGNASPSTSSQETNSSIENVSIGAKYKVVFENTSISDVLVNPGEKIQKPSDPVKNNYLFVGWYTDSTYKNEVTFPLTINSDTTIYALFYSYAEAFAKARNNTIGDSVAGYEYDYSLTIQGEYAGVAISGNTTGNAKYNPSSDVRFYDAHQNSGTLFYDGSKYEILKGTSLHTVSLDSKDVVKKYKIKDVGSDYKYDSSSFAKAVFEYDDSKLKSISKTNTANEYKLTTTFNASSAIALIGNYVNHPLVEMAIGKLPETSVNTGMYVTFNTKNLSKYRYEMNINVSGVNLNLTYNLSFKNIGVAPSINPRVFNNTYVSNSDISNAKSKINQILNTYKNLDHSSYDYEVKTGVDFPGKNEIDATVKGFTKRKVQNGVSYFLNDYEIDSDFKNSDLYKSNGLKDCHAGRAKLSNGEVHDLKKKLTSLGGSYDDKGIVSEDKGDAYYLLDVLNEDRNITFIQKLVDNKNNNKITYSIGGDENSAASLMEYFNSNLRINALGESNVDVKAFGKFNTSSINLKDFNFEIVMISDSLESIILEMSGTYMTSFVNSRDFTTSNEAKFELSYSLKVTADGSNYEPAASVSKIK